MQGRRTVVEPGAHLGAEHRNWGVSRGVPGNGRARNLYLYRLPGTDLLSAADAVMVRRASPVPTLYTSGRGLQSVAGGTWKSSRTVGAARYPLCPATSRTTKQAGAVTLEPLTVNYAGSSLWEPHANRGNPHRHLLFERNGNKNRSLANSKLGHDHPRQRNVNGPLR